MRILLILGAAACAACGNGGSGSPAPPPPREGSAEVPHDAPARVDLPARPLGLAELAGYQWRKRGGQAAFKAARLAALKNDYASVAASCRQALAADPGHLNAAYLLSVALGELGRPAQEIVGPLSLAAAGDFGTWGAQSLTNASLQKFLATPLGQAWRRRVDADHAAYVEALARSIVVLAEGELYAFDPVATRYHRLTNTGGAVVAMLAAPGTREVAYVTREGKKNKRELAVGIVELGKGRTTRPQRVGAPALQLAASAKGFLVGTGATWRVLAGITLQPLPGKAARPPRYLEVAGKTARLHALPTGTVTADWDDHGLASAMRIGSSNKIISVPSPGLIDGNTVTWSPDHTHLAFIAQLQADATCTPGSPRAAAYTADAATGAITLLYMPAIAATKLDSGLAIEWMSDRKLVLASGEGVAITSLDGPERTPLPGATELVTPRPRPRCQVAPDDEPEEPETTEVSAGSGSTMVGPP